MLLKFAQMPIRPDDIRPFIAVASREGMLVNQHLGEATELMIFKRNGANHELVGKRHTPEEGTGAMRWVQLAQELKDCAVLLVAAAGPRPKEILTREGLRVVEMEGMIDDGLRAVFSGQEIPAPMRREFKECGNGCRGTGNGCG